MPYSMSTFSNIFLAMLMITGYCLTRADIFLNHYNKGKKITMAYPAIIIAYCVESGGVTGHE